MPPGQPWSSEDKGKHGGWALPWETGGTLLPLCLPLKSLWLPFLSSVQREKAAFLLLSYASDTCLAPHMCTREHTPTHTHAPVHTSTCAHRHHQYVSAHKHTHSHMPQHTHACICLLRRKPPGGHPWLQNVPCLYNTLWLQWPLGPENVASQREGGLPSSQGKVCTVVITAIVNLVPGGSL